jgi:His-Xaa-Ser system protein HxsD
MQYKDHVNGNEIVAYADVTLYTKEAVFKCLYWYGDKFQVTVNVENDAVFKISLIPQDSGLTEATDLNLYLQKLERDLIDFNLRDMVSKETRNVRDLLIAKAFSNGEFDELPPGEVTDPVGYDVRL